MNGFLNAWNQGDFKAPKVFLTVALVIAFFFLGSLPLIIVLNSANVKDLAPTDWGNYFGKDTLFVLEIMPFLAVFIALWISNKYVHLRSFIWVVSARSKIDFKRFFWGFSVWSLLILVNFGISYKLNPSDFVWQFKAGPFWTSFFILLLLLPVQVFVEEWLFRSYILQGLFARTRSFWASVLISGVMFGMMHQGNPEVDALGVYLLLLYVFIGMVLSYIAAKDAGIEVTVGFHLANNLLTAVLMTSPDQAIQTNALFELPEIGLDFISISMLLISLLIFVVLYYLMYNRKVGDLQSNTN